MNLYKGNILGTDWVVAIEADKFKIENGCTSFILDNGYSGRAIALYPTEKLIINEIIYDYDSKIDN